MPTVTQLSPQLLALLQLLAGASATAPTATAPTSTLAEDLSDLLGGIPIAHDGDVITAEYHNSLRDAIGLIAEAVEVEELAKVQTLSFPPTLHEVAGQNPWRLDIGVAKGPDVVQTEENEAHGWMPLDLPNGTRIEGVSLRGDRQGAVGGWAASVTRQEIASGDQVEVFRTELQDLPQGKFTKNLDLVTPEDTGLTPTQIEELRRVDRARYRYLFFTVVDDAASGGDITLADVQVTLGRS